jgi:C4-dicarboxylate-specific signal transduction histidine kinase
MKIIVHDLYMKTQNVYEGDPVTMERKLDEDYPWAVSGNEGKLEQILWNIDHCQTLAVEVADALPHPFLKG